MVFIIVAPIICTIFTACGKSVDSLIKELEHPDSNVRESAALALRDTGDSKAVEPLIEALNDESYEVRDAAAEALGQIGDPRAVDPLIKALNDEAWQVRMIAAYALGYIGDPRAVESLIEAINDDDSKVREGVAYALGKLGEPIPASIFSQVCEGTGIPQAAAYQGNIHPVVLLDSGGHIHEWSKDMPTEWVTTKEETQLVACLERKANEIETCQYEDAPSITRYRYTLDVVLREAKTGEIVASTTLYGSLPRPCEQTEEYELTVLKGSDVSSEQLQEWLEEYVYH